MLKLQVLRLQDRRIDLRDLRTVTWDIEAVASRSSSIVASRPEIIRSSCTTNILGAVFCSGVLSILVKDVSSFASALLCLVLFS